LLPTLPTEFFHCNLSSYADRSFHLLALGRDCPCLSSIGQRSSGPTASRSYVVPSVASGWDIPVFSYNSVAQGCLSGSTCKILRRFELLQVHNELAKLFVLHNLGFDFSDVHHERYSLAVPAIKACFDNSFLGLHPFRIGGVRTTSCDSAAAGGSPEVRCIEFCTPDHIGQIHQLLHIRR